MAGPVFANGIYGKKEKLSNGQEITIDDAYITESIRSPQAKIVAGFTTTQMPTLPVSDEQIKDIIEYFKTLGKDKNTKAPTAQ